MSNERRGTMKLHWSSRSPLPRKVMFAARGMGMADRPASAPTRNAITRPNHVLERRNPLRRIPTLVTDAQRASERATVPVGH